MPHSVLTPLNYNAFFLLHVALEPCFSSADFSFILKEKKQFRYIKVALEFANCQEKYQQKHTICMIKFALGVLLLYGSVSLNRCEA
jgi:hypothetical protein